MFIWIYTYTTIYELYTDFLFFDILTNGRTPLNHRDPSAHSLRKDIWENLKIKNLKLGTLTDILKIITTISLGFY